MSTVISIWKKEARSYFNSPIAYLFLFFFLVYAALKFFIWTSPGAYGTFRGNFFIRGEATLTDYFNVFPYAMGLLVSVLCMRLWPEELKSGTIETLMTMPIRSHQIVFGKFLAMLQIVALALAISLTVPISVSTLAVDGLDWGPVIGGYIAALLMGAAYCSIGLFASSFTREQVVALLVSLVVCGILAFAGTPDIDLTTPEALSPIGKFIGFAVRFESIEKGVLDVRDMFYFLSVTGIFISLNIAVVEYRRLK